MTTKEEILALAGEPVGYYFRDDPSKFAMPGAGYSPMYPTDALDIVPLYTADQVLAARKPLEEMHASMTKSFFELREKLAASQAREQQLRDWVEANGVHDDICNCLYTDDEDKHGECSCGLSTALALPQDTTALEALIAKAGDVMRERCAEDMQSHYLNAYAVTGAGHSFAKSIRALPGVTLDDLK